MTKLKAMISLACASIIAGSTVAISRLVSEGSSIYCLQFFSLILASILLFFWIGPKKLKGQFKKTTKKDYSYLALQAFTGIVLFRVLIVYGVKMTSTMDAGIILSFVPVATVILAMLFLGERLGKREWIAVGCAFIGVLIINITGASEASSKGDLRLMGNLMVLIATISEGAFAILSKKISNDMTPIMKSFFLCIFAAMLFFPLSVVELANNSSFILESGFWMLTLYTGVVLTVVGYIFWFTGVSHVSGSLAGVFTALIPVSSIVLVTVLFNERMTVSQLIGLGFVLYGVIGMMLPIKIQGKKLLKKSKKEGFI